MFIIERNPEIQLFQDVCPSAEFVEKIPNMSDSIIKTTIDGWNVTTLTRVCSEHQDRSVPMILENDRLKVVLHTSTVKHHGKPSLNVCKWTVPSAGQEISADQEIRNEPSTTSKKTRASPEDSDKLKLCKLALEGKLLNKTDLGTPRAKKLLVVNITQKQMKNYLEKQNAHEKNGKNQSL